MKGQLKIRKHTAWLAVFLTAALLSACSDFFEPHAISEKAKIQGPLLDETPFDITVYVGDRDSAEQPTDSLAARTISDEINGFGEGVWNYAQIIVMENNGEGGKRLVAWDESRDDGNGDGRLWIGTKGITMTQEYTFLLLMGHWEWKKGVNGKREYIGNAPTLLAAGCEIAKPGEARRGRILITMHPLAVRVNFTGTGNGGDIRTLEPPVEGGKIKPVILEKVNEKADWTANWIMTRNALKKLLEAEDSSEGFDTRFPADMRKALIGTGGVPGEVDTIEVASANGKASLNITDYADKTTRYVNFNLKYQPFRGRGGDDPPPGTCPDQKLRPVFGPWIIRNGVNDLPQNEHTDFSYDANWNDAANGNGAVAFEGSFLDPAPAISEVKRVFDQRQAGITPARALRASSNGGGGDYEDQIKVTWAKVPEASSYTVYWSTPNEAGELGKKELSGGDTTTAYIFGDEHNPQLGYHVWVDAKVGLSSVSSGLVPSPSRMTFTDFANAVRALEGSKIANLDVTVGGDESIAGPIIVANPGNFPKAITIEGVGKTITNTGTGSFLTIAGGTVTLSNLTLRGGDNVVTVTGGNLVLKAGATVTGGSASGVSITGGTFTTDGGTISGNDRGVSLSGGTFTMNGGEISGNTSDGVVVNSGTFTMENGTISGSARGVSLSGGTFTMNSGEISGNTSDGVVVNSGTFTMENGTISNNTGSGAGVYVSGNSTFIMAGGTISNNTGLGGVAVSGSDSTFIMNDGTISGNGGSDGVHISGSNSTFTMAGGTISNNAGSAGVHVSGSNSTISMNGGTISNNAGHGVRVLSSSSTFTMARGTISGHSSGSGVAWSSGAVITKRDGGTVYGNLAEVSANLKNAGGSLGTKSETFGPTDFYPAP
jgi:hypothetical protein